MKRILFLLGFMNMIWTVVFADSVDIKVDPYEPVINEPFSVTFNIDTQSSKEPYISFDPGSAEVIGRERGGVSLQTTIINGKITSKREMSYTYQLVTDRPGILTIGNISIDTGNEKVEHRPLKIKVLRKGREAKKIFVRAEVSKNSLYLGEGAELNYYLYSLVQTGGSEIKKFPKLKGFVKRFRNLQTRAERVEESGRVYLRQLIYSARIFPEKAGELKIDPITINVQYAAGRGGSPLGGFGFQFRQYKQKTLSSRPIGVNVLPIPSGIVPKNFTGLVGRHNFSLSASGNKFLVNEAIELKLTVEGPGMLENYDGPKIYTHQELEAFDTKSEMIQVTEKISKKVFDYTYLARGPLDVGEQEIELSYFDPEKSSFVPVKLKIPPLKIGGSASSGQRQRPLVNKEQEGGKDLEAKQKTVYIEIIAPEFSSFKVEKGVGKSTIRYTLYIFILLFLALLLLLLGKNIHFKSTSPLDKTIKKMEKEGVDYSDLYGILNLLAGNNGQNNIESIINGSRLSEAAKGYFKHSLALAERGNFAGGKRENIVFKKKFFLELSKVINEKN